MAEVKPKEGDTIQEGYHVYTKFRGGRREGDVEKIVKTQEEAEKEGVKNPPKVLFTDQNDKHVAHNPSTLTNTDKSEPSAWTSHIGSLSRCVIKRREGNSQPCAQPCLREVQNKGQAFSKHISAFQPEM